MFTKTILHLHTVGLIQEPTPVIFSMCPIWIKTSCTVLGFTLSTGSCPPTEIPPYLGKKTAQYQFTRALCSDIQ